MDTRRTASKRSRKKQRAQSLALCFLGPLLVFVLVTFAGAMLQQKGAAQPSAPPRYTSAAGQAALPTTSSTPASSTSSAQQPRAPYAPPGLNGKPTQILAELGHPDRALLVSIDNQTLYAYQGSTMVAWSFVTTGRPELQTPRGSYSILQRQHDVMFYSKWPPSSPYYYPPTPVTYALRFLGTDFFLHDYSPRHYYGPGTNIWHQNPDGTWESGSHGCVEAPLAFMQWLYNWASIGAPVVIY